MTQTEHSLTRYQVKFEQLLKENIVIAGDFNQDEWGDKNNKSTTPDLGQATSMKPLFANNFVCDGNLESTEYKRQTSNDYSSAIVEKNRKIDHIFVKSMNGIANPQHLELKNFNLTGSDHKAVATLL